MLKAVIFDMDGVLVDSEPLHYEANRLLFERKFGINLDYGYYKQYIGSTVTYMWEKMRRDFILMGHEYVGMYEAIELRNMADEIKEELVEEKGYEEIEGVGAFVKSLSGHYKLAVASSSYLQNIERNVRKLDLQDEFHELVSGTQVRRPKPCPDIFLLAAERLKVESCECLVIEDSENGVLAAKAAGMACLGFINPNSGEQNLSRADYLFEAFSGIDGDFLEMVHSHTFDERYVIAETDRLVIREMLENDVEDLTASMIICEALSGENSGHSEVDLKSMSVGELKDYIADYRKNSYKFLGFGLWLLELKDTGKVIGLAGIDRKETGDFELGYYVDEAHRRCGYAYEACEKILAMKEELGIEDICVRIKTDNMASNGLAVKLGLNVLKS